VVRPNSSPVAFRFEWSGHKLMAFAHWVLGGPSDAAQGLTKGRSRAREGGAVTLLGVSVTVPLDGVSPP
jgi:hypothetical protein